MRTLKQKLGWRRKAAEEPATVERTTPKSEYRTYRIHEVPLECDEAKLEQFLNKDQERTRFRVKSLALEYHGSHKTATVDASEGAKLPVYINVPSDTSWVADSKEFQLQTDDNFHGLTTLFRPPEAEHRVEYDTERKITTIGADSI